MSSIFGINDDTAEGMTKCKKSSHIISIHSNLEITYDTTLYKKEIEKI